MGFEGISKSFYNVLAVAADDMEGYRYNLEQLLEQSQKELDSLPPVRYDSIEYKIEMLQRYAVAYKSTSVYDPLKPVEVAARMEELRAEVAALTSAVLAIAEKI